MTKIESYMLFLLLRNKNDIIQVLVSIERNHEHLTMKLFTGIIFIAVDRTLTSGPWTSVYAYSLIIAT